MNLGTYIEIYVSIIMVSIDIQNTYSKLSHIGFNEISVLELENTVFAFGHILAQF